MKRISVDDVKSAYEKTGLKPVRKDFGNGHNCGCPLLVTLAARGSETPYSDSLDVYVAGGYAYGFVVAVDGDDPCWLSNEHTQDRDQGYQDGIAVRTAIWPATKGENE